MKRKKLPQLSCQAIICKSHPDMRGVQSGKGEGSLQTQKYSVWYLGRWGQGGRGGDSAEPSSKTV